MYKRLSRANKRLQTTYLLTYRVWLVHSLQRGVAIRVDAVAFARCRQRLRYLS